MSALAPLCKSIVTDKNYSTKLLNVTSGHIGIGTVNTWYGTPDMRLEAESSYVDVVVPRVSAVSDMYVEDKVDINRKEDKVRSQVVATTVVASFTNSNVYKKSMAPVVLLCKRLMCVCMYNCDSDILLYSTKVPISNDVGVAALLCISGT